MNRTLRSISMLCSIFMIHAIAAPLLPRVRSQEFGNESRFRTAHRKSIERGMELLRGSVDRYPEHRRCFSCHHQAVPLFAMRMAKEHSLEAREFVWTKDADRVNRMVDLTYDSLALDLKRLSSGEELDGRGLSLGYAMWTLDVSTGDRADLMDRLIDIALATQREDGGWRIHSHRPPASSSDRMATALITASLLKHAPDHARREEMADALCRARWWHLNTPLPSETEDIAGMLWCNYVFDEMDRRNVFTRNPDFPTRFGSSDPDLWFLWRKKHLGIEDQAREWMISASQSSIRSSDALWRLQNPDGG